MSRRGRRICDIYPDFSAPIVFQLSRGISLNNRRGEEIINTRNCSYLMIPLSWAYLILFDGQIDGQMEGGGGYFSRKTRYLYFNRKPNQSLSIEPSFPSLSYWIKSSYWVAGGIRGYNWISFLDFLGESNIIL